MKQFMNPTKSTVGGGSLQACPCCGEKTLSESGGYEICEVCGWEDDGQDDYDADEVRGGPNGRFSLTEARKLFHERKTRKQEWK